MIHPKPHRQSCWKPVAVFQKAPNTFSVRIILWRLFKFSVSSRNLVQRSLGFNGFSGSTGGFPWGSLGRTEAASTRNSLSANLKDFE